MTAFDTRRLARLSRLLGQPARTVVLAAARIAQRGGDENADAAGSLHRLARAPHARAGEGAGALLATPIADFAQDDVDRALAAQPGGDADA